MRDRGRWRNSRKSRPQSRFKQRVINGAKAGRGGDGAHHPHQDGGQGASLRTRGNDPGHGLSRHAAGQGEAWPVDRVAGPAAAAVGLVATTVTGHERPGPEIAPCTLFATSLDIAPRFPQTSSSLCEKSTAYGTQLFEGVSIFFNRHCQEGAGSAPFVWLFAHGEVEDTV